MSEPHKAALRTIAAFWPSSRLTSTLKNDPYAQAVWVKKLLEHEPRAIRDAIESLAEKSDYPPKLHELLSTLNGARVTPQGGGGDRLGKGCADCDLLGEVIVAIRRYAPEAWREQDNPDQEVVEVSCACDYCDRGRALSRARMSANAFRDTAQRSPRVLDVLVRPSEGALVDMKRAAGFPRSPPRWVAEAAKLRRGW